MSLNSVSMSLFPISDCQFVLLIPVARAPITESSLVMPNPLQSAIGNRKSAMPSLVPQRDQRIDFGGAPCWQIRREQSNRNQQERDKNKSCGIGGADAAQ